MISFLPVQDVGDLGIEITSLEEVSRRRSLERLVLVSMKLEFTRRV